MKPVFILLFVLGSLGEAAIDRSRINADDLDFVCMKKHMASKTCHYNFKVAGAKYRFVDIGCKFKKQDEVIDKAKEGTIALAKDWKIACPEMPEEEGR